MYFPPNITNPKDLAEPCCTGEGTDLDCEYVSEGKGWFAEMFPQYPVNQHGKNLGKYNIVNGRTLIYGVYHSVYIGALSRPVSMGHPVCKYNL